MSGSRLPVFVVYGPTVATRSYENRRDADKYAERLAGRGHEVAVYRLEAACSPGVPQWTHRSAETSVVDRLRKSADRLRSLGAPRPLLANAVDDADTFYRPGVAEDTDDEPTSVPGAHLACTIHPAHAATHQLEDSSGRVMQRLCAECRASGDPTMRPGDVVRPILAS